MDDKDRKIALLETEIERLQRLAHWHNKPRVRIKRNHDLAGREGHIIERHVEDSMVMLDGAMMYLYIPTNYIEYIGSKN